MRKHFLLSKNLLLAACIAGLAFSLAACNEQDTAATEQTFGPSPTLPAPETTVNVAKAIGWRAGSKPVAANGMGVNAFATGLDHPRTLFVLPNGDVLVAETNAPPKPDDTKGIKGWITKMVMGRAGADTSSANRITLLRDANGDGIAETKTVFLEGLNSPFGMALVGNDFYVAASDAILKFSLTRPATPKLPSRASSWWTCRRAPSTITGPRTSSQVATDQSSMPPLAPTAISAKMAWRPRPIALPYWKSIAPPASGACSPRVCAIRTDRRGSRRAARCGSR
jgi:hypothetical protein